MVLTQRCVSAPQLLCLAVLSSFLLGQAASYNCSAGSACGWLAVCSDHQCVCQDPFTLHANGRDCQNDSCSSDSCLQCDTPDVCLKCVSFISQSAGVCLSRCEGTAEERDGNLVCTGRDSEGVDVVVAVAVGVGAGAVVCLLVVIGVCVYVRRTIRNVDLQSKHYSSRQMETGHVKQFPTYQNDGFETESQADYSPHRIDPLEYANELDRLRPQADTLMALLSQTRSKTRAMAASDPRLPTYKGVIHQLCRVLVLLHKKDPVVSIPSDAPGLLHWAQQMLDDHREQQSSSGGTIELPVAQISTVDLGLEAPTSPVYATPDSSQGHSSPIPPAVASPYSSVPVPVNHGTFGRSKRPGFATISRTPSVPNGALIRSLEADDNIQNIFAGKAESNPGAESRTSTFLRREDFQSFLIDGGEKSEAHNSSLERSSNKENLASESVQTISKVDGFDGEAVVEMRKRTLKPNQPAADRPVPAQKPARAKYPGAAPPGGGIESAKSVKKNIITNPNAIKKSSSLTAKHGKASTSAPTMGYFANGHYYDPNPMPVQDGELYAPGSSYSDRSNVMSTFLGDLPNSRSPSASSCEDDGEDSENSGGDLDVFPFDPNDATDPVEV
ncbi:uncharacterized protein LOC101847162 [Aplysia californica]|uniref:Uncharacterized protein LOC101847162 n=1 Tax=Aplysia californica TaxID=6500 RepID=A0ABM1AD84_APLCA|nr:uncharacterized protein LOC101847162 [Aplysia californica]